MVSHHQHRYHHDRNKGHQNDHGHHNHHVHEDDGQHLDHYKTGATTTLPLKEAFRFEDHDHTKENCCCCMEEKNDDQDCWSSGSSKAFCLAIVMAEDNKVVVFDTNGKARTFSMMAAAGDDELNPKTIQDLCFYSPGSRANKLLTPCLDGQGRHGIPEEVCFCGVDTPHLHAHYMNPETCGPETCGRGRPINDDDEEEEKQYNDDWKERLNLLATQILHPTELKGNANNDDDGDDEDDEIVSFPISHDMPRDCTSEGGNRKLKQHCKAQCQGRRVVHPKVHHGDDHFDSLVHNRKTHALTLEHDNCSTCGQADLHGTFRLTGAHRSWPSSQSNKENNQHEHHQEKPAHISIHFYDISPVALDLSSQVNQLFVEQQPQNHDEEIDSTLAVSGVKTNDYDVPVREVTIHHVSCQVSAETPLQMLNEDEVEASKSTAVATTTTVFHCNGICCKSEVILIDDLLKPMDGIVNVTYDVPGRKVVVEHVASKILAKNVLKLLNDDDFEAWIVADHAVTATTAVPPFTTTTTKTTFYCNAMCCSSEVSSIDDLLKTVDGIEKISYEVPKRKVIVEHVDSRVPAQTILKLLNDDGFEASIVVVAAIAATTTVFYCQGLCCSSEVPLVEDSLQSVDGIRDIRVDVPAKKVIVEHVITQVSSETILKLLNNEDFEASIVDVVVQSDDVGVAAAIETTTFVCRGICCSSEVPLIDDLLKPVDGIKSIRYDVPSKKVIVDHVVSIISAEAILKMLNDDDFEASITTVGADGTPYDNKVAVKTATIAPVCLRATAGAIFPAGPDALATSPPIPAALASKSANRILMGRSIIYVDSICCASEIPSIRSILEPLAGVSKVSVVVTTKLVYVDHDCHVISAKDICKALNKERFGANLRLDGEDAAAASAGNTLFCMSTFSFDESAIDITQEEMEIVFSGLFGKTQVQSLSVESSTKTVSVVHNSETLSAKDIEAALSKIFKSQVHVLVDGKASVHIDYSALENVPSKCETEGHNKKVSNTYPRPTVIISGVLWLISMLSFIGGIFDNLKYVGLASVVFGLPPIVRKAFYQLKRIQFDANCLMLFASLGALALGEFTEAAAVVFLFALSEWLEVRATTKARHSLEAIVNLKPNKANVVHPDTNELLVVPASAVPVGALVVVKNGEAIPCDGIVVQGQSTVDESSLTGESRPVAKGLKDEVLGGTLNSGHSQLLVRTTASAENSAVARLIRLVEEAQANRSETEKLVDDFAKYYTPVILITAICFCTISWAFGRDTGRRWTELGLVLIVVACPCALIISTPVAYVAGIAATAQKGILIKGGAFLESLGRVKVVFFDKTGTLTNGDFALLHLEVTNPKGEFDLKKVLEYLSLIEERASHPVAHAILTRARNEGVSVPISRNMMLQKHTLLAGEGVVGVISGQEVYVGNERLFERLGLLHTLSQKMLSAVEAWKHFGGTIGFMSVEGHGIVCAYCAADGVRPESKTVVGNLKKRGISTTMLTGDNQEASLSVGRQIGLGPDEIRSKLLPEEKLEHLNAALVSGREGTSMLRFFKTRKQNVVLFCGDGVNDAPALAAADVGVAMGAGAALAMETADVTLLDSNLAKLEYTLHVGRLVMRKIWENVLFSIVTKAIVVGFAIAGKAHLWSAIATDVGAMILVTLNAMTIIPRNKGHECKLLFSGPETDVEKQQVVDEKSNELVDEPLDA